MNKDNRTPQLVDTINRKSSFLVIVGIILTIIIIITMGYVIHINHELEEIEHRICPLSPSPTSDLTCTDFDPCTRDTKLPLPPGVSTECPSTSFYCSHAKLPDNTPCNRDDSCYYDDPAKRCLNGQCVSPNVTKCKGYCTQDADCQVTLPFTVDPTSAVRYDYCAFGSCVTQLLLEQIDTADPYSLLDTNTGNLTNLNISSCLDAICRVYTPFFASRFGVCLYTWHCAPFVVAYAAEAINVSGTEKAPWFFPLPGLWGADYHALNTRIMTLANQSANVILRRQ